MVRVREEDLTTIGRSNRTAVKALSKISGLRA